MVKFHGTIEIINSQHFETISYHNAQKLPSGQQLKNLMSSLRTFDLNLLVAFDVLMRELNVSRAAEQMLSLIHM